MYEYKLNEVEINRVNIKQKVEGIKRNEIRINLKRKKLK